MTEDEVIELVSHVNQKEEEFIKAKSHMLEHVDLEDQTVPLDLRFDIWAYYATKVDQETILREGEFEPLGTLVNDVQIPSDPIREVCYNWEYFLDEVSDCYAEDEAGVIDILSRHDIYDIDGFKEQLIRLNFGSYVHDW